MAAQNLRPHSFAVVLPYYNEAEYLEQTLLSWIKQERKPDQLILVDNGSEDGSAEVARPVLDGVGDIETVYLTEKRPGKIFALETGCAAVNCEFTILSDADTFYPEHYLALCEKLFSRYPARVSALMALPETERPDAVVSRLRRRYFWILHKIFPRHTYTGGYGQVFRTRDLERAGGFSIDIWPHVLLDHEIMYRVLKNGSARYHVDLWCQSSPRRGDRSRVRWSFWERMLYQCTPHRFQGWFFYRFLARRFQRRGLNQDRLREKTWEKTVSSK